MARKQKKGFEALKALFIVGPHLGHIRVVSSHFYGSFVLEAVSHGSPT